MTFGRSSVKKARSNKLASIAALIAAAAALCIASSAHAQGGVKQYQRQLMLGGRLHGALLILGYEKDSANIEKLMDIVYQKANESYARLDWQNPSSEVSRINASAGQSGAPASDDVVEAFKTAQKISKWTNGAFDVIFGGTGHYKDVSVGGSSVNLKNAGMQAHFDGMIEGFMAELMIRYVYAAGMQNAMVKVGNTFRGIGMNVMGPWKIQVQDDEGGFAHHALNLSVSNTGIATVSANQFKAQPLVDPRTNSQVGQPCRGVTVVMNDAALAQGVANAVFLVGP
ncbi:MAG: FAD:protein FMN transferase, partial [bacterium]